VFELSRQKNFERRGREGFAEDAKRRQKKKWKSLAAYKTRSDEFFSFVFSAPSAQSLRPLRSKNEF
jgi:hypothetical protein